MLAGSFRSVVLCTLGSSMWDCGNSVAERSVRVRWLVEVKYRLVSGVTVTLWGVSLAGSVVWNY